MDEQKNQETEPKPVDRTAEEATEPEPKPAKKISIGGSRWHRLKTWYVSHKKLSIPLTVLVLLLLLAVVPWTRYKIGGLFIKKDVLVYTADSKSGSTIYQAGVTLDGKRPGASGKPPYPYYFKGVSIGRHKISFGASYYKSSQNVVTIDVGLSKNHNIKILGQATGRLVTIRLTNKISGKAVPNLQVKAGKSVTKTDWKGDGSVVVDPNLTSVQVEISGQGYNTFVTKVPVNAGEVNFNQVVVVPAGKIYFLSKLSGKIDVVKTDLDGANRQTVLAGTGNEDDQNTVLLASRDWKYLALLSRRAGTFDTLYLIDTSNDSLTVIDEGDVTFDLLGWSDNYFTYVVHRPSVSAWQSNASSIKSYNAQTKQLISLNSTSATGSSNADAVYETYIIKPILLDNVIVYEKTWYKYPGYLTVDGHTNSLNAIKPDGTGSKQIKILDSAKSYFGDMVFHSPSSVYVGISNVDGSAGSYYELNLSGALTQKDLTSDDVFKTYPTYLFSPNDKQTFWAEPRDGKNTLLIGDSDGLNGKSTASLSDYSPYGWYTDTYLLVSKNSSELYIMPADGTKNPTKISDYHKPAQSFNGYGGGYGGI